MSNMTDTDTDTKAVPVGSDDLRIRIPNELFAPAATAHYEGTWTLPVLKAGADLYSFTEPLSWQVDITNTGGAFLVAGTVEGEASVSCARCLEPALYDLTGDVEGYFVVDAAESTAVAEDGDGEEGDIDDLEGDEFDYLPADNTIDLEPLLFSALLLDVPTLPLCTDDCKGLCPDCGANLNTESCDCAEVRQEADAEFEAAKNPFAALAGITFGEDVADGDAVGKDAGDVSVADEKDA